MANDTTLRLRYVTGGTFYVQINNDVAVWNGTAYVAKVLADWASYATPMPETPAGFGEYVAQFPTASDPGHYSWAVFRQAGAGPAATTDVCVGTGEGYWDGDTFGGASKVTGGVEASLPAQAPEGYGPVGTGSVAVNQDYPTPGNLALRVSPTGPGIGGAQVRAYLASEWAAALTEAKIRGQTLTLDTGGWANPMMLDPAEYSFVFIAEDYETTVVTLTVA